LLNAIVPLPAFVTPKPAPLTSAEIVKSLVASPLLTVNVGVTPNAKLPAIVAPVVPEPFTLSVRLLPNVNVPVPVVTFAPNVDPEYKVNVVIELLKPLRSKVPGASTVKGCAVEKALAIPDCSVPELTVNPPEIATLRFSSNTPAPFCVKPPVPVTTVLAPRVKFVIANIFASVVPNANVSAFADGLIVFAPPIESMFPLSPAPPIVSVRVPPLLL